MKVCQYSKVCRHSLTYAVVTFRKIWLKSNLVQTGIEYTYSQMYVYMSPVEIPTLEPDLSQSDSPAAFVIAQQYSSATFVSLRYYSRQEKIQCFSKNVVLKLLYVLEGTAVAQLVEALRYKSEGRGFDSRWCHWNFSLT